MFKKFDPPLKCSKFHQLSNETIPKVVAACFFVAGAVEWTCVSDFRTILIEI